RIVLDANTTLRVETAENDDGDSVLELQKGRILVKADTPVQIYHEDGFQAELIVGSIGVEVNRAATVWQVDCLAGMCRLSQEDQEDDPVELIQGQSAQLSEDADMEPMNTQLARIATYNNLDASIILPTATSTATPTVTASATATPTTSSTPTNTPDPEFLGPETIMLGVSAGGKDIEVVRFGNGPEVVLLVGGIHYGYAPNSVALMQQLIEYFGEKLTAIPDNVTLYIVSNINPDTPVSPGKLVGRLNANGVDLNRNWDCRWLPNALILGEIVPGSGGTEVFSEPETQLLKNFIEQSQPNAVIFWEVSDNKDGLVSPGACEVRSLVSVPLVQYYANATGYDYVNKQEVLANFELTGDVSNWLDKIGIPALFILLPDFEEYEFQRELQGVLSVLTAIAEPQKIQQTPTPVSCSEPVNPAWAALHAEYQFRLGCAESGVTQPQSVWQPFEHGRILWRQDTNTVYVLYDDFSLSSFVVDDASLAGFAESELVKGAIGYVWRTNTAVSSKIGQPTDQEREAADVNLQDFSQGFIISWQETSLQTNLLFLDLEQWQTP
ncbi:MAG: hypothetical protein KC449_09960, partial [Anaerolineales bacterium]|nr:hypothetical protein [Anaerolineales bacterium]